MAFHSSCFPEEIKWVLVRYANTFQVSEALLCCLSMLAVNRCTELSLPACWPRVHEKYGWGWGGGAVFKTGLGRTKKVKKSICRPYRMPCCNSGTLSLGKTRYVWPKGRSLGIRDSSLRGDDVLIQGFTSRSS